MTYFGYQPPLYTADHYSRAEVDALMQALQTRDDRIINGAFDIWQRGLTQSVAGYGSADRWRVDLVGGSASLARQLAALGTKLGLNTVKYFARLTASGQAAAGDFVTASQRIEDVGTYSGETITVLGWAKRFSGAGDLGVSLGQSFGTGGSPSPFQNIAGGKVSLTTDWQAFAVPIAVPSISGRTLGSGANDFLGLYLWASAGSNFSALVNSLGVQTIGIDLWGVHIRRGVHTADATNFYVAPPVDETIAKCQRYYNFRNDVLGAMYATNGLVYDISFPVEMRATPNVSIVSSAGTLNSPQATSAGYRAYYTGTVIGTANIIADAEL